MNKKIFFWLLAMSFILIGCGQSGPLYLPQNTSSDQHNEQK